MDEAGLQAIKERVEFAQLEIRLDDSLKPIIEEDVLKLIQALEDSRHREKTLAESLHLCSLSENKLREENDYYSSRVDHLAKSNMRRRQQREKYRLKNERLQEENNQFRDFISACRYAGKDGLPQLRKDANYLLCGKPEKVDLNKILR